MDAKRSRRAQDAGREKVLEAARSLFRAKVKHEVSRQQIARQAGVVPGLLTYHFETNAALVLAATHPVLATAIRALVEALDSPASCEQRFRKCIELFLDFAAQNASILDLYVETAIESGDHDAQTLITSTLDRLGRFFEEAVGQGLIAEDTNPQFLLLALWGMCRLIGGTRPVPLPVLNEERQFADTRDVQVELILQFVLKGVGRTTPMRSRARTRNPSRPPSNQDEMPAPRPRNKPRTPRS